MIVGLWVGVVVTWVFLLLLSVAVLALYRHFGQLYINSPQGRTEQGPEIGSAILSFADIDRRGREVRLSASRPAALLFVDTTCTLCAAVRQGLSALEGAPDAQVVVFCAGQLQDVDAWADGLPENVLVVHDPRSGYANKYEVNGTPYAVVTGVNGIVHGKSIINGVEGVHWIISEIRHADAEPLPMAQGEHEYP